MKIGVITVEDLKDKKAWSGIIYRIYNSLSHVYGCENIMQISTSIGVIGRVYVCFIKLLAKLFNRKFLFLDDFLSKCLACSVCKAKVAQVDILLAPAGSCDIAYLKTSKPIIYFSDATFKLLYEYYPNNNNYFSFQKKRAFNVEQKALLKASHLIYASDWAKESALNDYHVSSDKISVLEFGANIDDVDILPCDKKKDSLLHILFLGVDWLRKGGDVAVECVQYLNKTNIKAVLHVVGIKTLPEKYSELDCIINHGFLDKNTLKDYNEIISIMQSSNLLLLPTRAECAGIAFAEASAFGLPVFTYKTGGVGNYVIDGVNGYKLGLESSGEDFAHRIMTSLNTGEFEQLSRGGKELYHSKLNWSRWGVEFDKIAKRVVQNG